MLNMAAIGSVYDDMPDPAPKDLKSDIASKWKLEDMEYQNRKMRNARTG